MEIIWKNFRKENGIEIENWLSDEDRKNLCLTEKNWEETADDIASCLKLMENGQFRNVVGFFNGEAVVALMFGVEFSGARLNIYNILVNPSKRGKGFGKEAIRSIFSSKNVFCLNKTYNKIVAFVFPQNDCGKKLFSGLGFEIYKKEGEFVVFEKSKDFVSKLEGKCSTKDNNF